MNMVGLIIIVELWGSYFSLCFINTNKDNSYWFYYFVVTDAELDNASSMIFVKIFFYFTIFLNYYEWILLWIFFLDCVAGLDNASSRIFVKMFLLCHSIEYFWIIMNEYYYEQFFWLGWTLVFFPASSDMEWTIFMVIFSKLYVFYDMSNIFFLEILWVPQIWWIPHVSLLYVQLISDLYEDIYVTHLTSSIDLHYNC